jgi:twitching motility protein PilT
MSNTSTTVPVELPTEPASAGEQQQVPRDIRELLELAVRRGASDLHLTESSPPLLRIDGSLEPTPMAALSRAQAKQLIYGLLTEQQQARFERDLELDFSLAVSGTGRVRVNVHRQRGSVEAAFRMIPPYIRSLQELGLPPVVAELTRRPNGLILVTGPAGAGKTTTLAAMVDQINHERRHLVVVIEDPIEYVHRNHLSIIKQREVHADTRSFAVALVRALRQDPNVIVVGEMRDLETIATALTAAETGHLVLATLHTPDASQTVDRILDVFPPHQQEQVKVQLSGCLQGVVSQQLLPRIDAPGRVLAYEILIATHAVRNLIRDHATEQLPTLLETGARFGMCTMDACLKDLYDRKVIAYETAMSRVKHPGEFHLFGKAGSSSVRLTDRR